MHASSYCCFNFTVDALYERSEKRTAVPMLIITVLYAIVLIGLLVLYRVLDPRELKTDEHANGGTVKEEEKPLVTDKRD